MHVPAQVLGWNKKQGAAPPPKVAEWQYPFSQAMLHAKHTHIYIFFIYWFILIFTCREVYCKCDLNKEAGGGTGGGAQRLPPKQNDNAKTYVYKYIYIHTHAERCIASVTWIQKRGGKAEWQYLFSQAMLHAKNHIYIYMQRSVLQMWLE